MTEYAIIQDHFTASDCYKSNKRLTPRGIQVHSVGTKGTTLARWKRSWNQPGRDVCAAYVVDINGIYQLLPDGKRCWLSGSGPNGNANDTYIGFEICEPAADTADNAELLYSMTLYLCCMLCTRHSIHPSNIKAHYELHAMGLASNHADVRHWWGKKGTPWEPYTMDRLRKDVANWLEVSMITPVQETLPTLRKNDRGDYVRAAQTYLKAHGYDIGAYEKAPDGIDGIFGDNTLAAVKKFQLENGLKVDGVIGADTWGALMDNSPEDEPEEKPEDVKRGTFAFTVPNITPEQSAAIMKFFEAAKLIGVTIKAVG